MGFPLFGLLAVTASAGWGSASSTPRLRLSGARLRRRLRLGWRRVVLETGPLVAVIVSAWRWPPDASPSPSALADGSERQLQDKADVYVGTDLAIDVSTVRGAGRLGRRDDDGLERRRQWDDGRADLMGVDARRSRTMATMRADGASRVAG